MDSEERPCFGATCAVRMSVMWNSSVEIHNCASNSHIGVAPRLSKYEWSAHDFLKFDENFVLKSSSSHIDESLDMTIEQHKCASPEDFVEHKFLLARKVEKKTTFKI